MERRVRSSLDLVKLDLHKRVERKQERQKAACDPHTVICNFKVRDLVYARNYTRADVGTWILTEVMGPRRYREKLLNEDRVGISTRISYVIVTWKMTIHNVTNSRRYRNLFNNRRFSPCLSTSRGLRRRCWNNCLKFHSGNRWNFEKNTSLPITRWSTSEQIFLRRTLSIKGRRDVMTVINKLPYRKELYSYLG